MKIVAKVYDYEITSEELDREIERVSKKCYDSDDGHIYSSALSLVIDRYLMLYEARQQDISICDEEYEAALLDILDLVDCFDNIEDELIVRGMQANQIENLLRNKIIVKKYIQKLCDHKPCIDDESLLAFYHNKKDFFFKDTEIRASHILVKGTDEASRIKANMIFKNIKTADDFTKTSETCSDCPSNAKCGDLGFFGRGQLIKEIEEVAFGLKLGEISKPFKTQYGYHILMLTEIKEKGLIPYEEIKESLLARLNHMENEYILSQHLNHLRKSHANHIIIL